MKILFVLGNYYEASTANAECVKNIADVLREQYFVECHYLCYGCANSETPYGEKREVATIRSSRFLGNKFFNGQITGIRRRLYLLKAFLVEPPYPMRASIEVERYKKMITRLNEHYKYDAVISVVQPLGAAEAVAAAEGDFKKILYEVDSITDEPALCCGWRRLFRRSCFKRERYIYDRMDLGIHLYSHKKYFEAEKYRKYAGKFVNVDIPMVSRRYAQSRAFKPQHKSPMLLYAGTLHETTRSPSYLFRLLEKVHREGSDFKMTFCSRGCDNLIKKEVETIGEKIDYKGYVTPLVMDDLYSKCDFLVSIGNSMPRILPSKIFQYMSTGRPIIHIYRCEDDACIPYLRKYRESLLINEADAFEVNQEKLRAFLYEKDHICESFENIKAAFKENTPEYTAKIIYDCIKGDEYYGTSC